MRQDTHNSASKVVELFKQEINSNSRKCLSNNDYERLTELITAAIAEDRNSTAELLERIASKIKSGTERFDLDL